MEERATRSPPSGGRSERGSQSESTSSKVGSEEDPQDASQETDKDAAHAVGEDDCRVVVEEVQKLTARGSQCSPDSDDPDGGRVEVVSVHPPSR